MMTEPNPIVKPLILLAEEGVVDGEEAPGNGGIAGELVVGIAGDEAGLLILAGGDFEGDTEGAFIGAWTGAVVFDGTGELTGVEAIGDLARVAGDGAGAEAEGVSGVAGDGAEGGGAEGVAGGGAADDPRVVITTFIPLSQWLCDPQIKYLFPEEVRLIIVIPPL